MRRNPVSQKGGSLEAQLDDLDRAINGAFTTALRNAVRDTFEGYIMPNSPVYTGAYKSNHQILLNGEGAQAENVSTSEERKVAEISGNRGAGPRGEPVGRFNYLIQDAEEQAAYAIQEISSKTTKTVEILNVSDHATIVEDRYKYMVYTEAAQFLKARLQSISGKGKGGKR